MRRAFSLPRHESTAGRSPVAKGKKPLDKPGPMPNGIGLSPGWGSMRGATTSPRRASYSPTPSFCAIASASASTASPKTAKITGSGNPSRCSQPRNAASRIRSSTCLNGRGPCARSFTVPESVKFSSPDPFLLHRPMARRPAPGGAVPPPEGSGAPQPVEDRLGTPQQASLPGELPVGPFRAASP